MRQVCPDMPMHASTQMSVQSIEGVRELEKMGFARVVLPRELSESEIAAIAAKRIWSLNISSTARFVCACRVNA